MVTVLEETQSPWNQNEFRVGRNFRKWRKDGVNRRGRKESLIERWRQLRVLPRRVIKLGASVVDRKIKAACVRGSCACRGGNIAYPFPIMRLHENTDRQIFQACTTKIPEIARRATRLRRLVKYSRERLCVFVRLVLISYNWIYIFFFTHHIQITDNYNISL